ncbi:sugar ABC transporter permease [Salinadaptatus halalkaliphilus]|uniref:Sugar ABC transporter permease n=1 Tax=Salinadaptatus halalkaliphilus TaxID=2419781 RepID=A0A4V3VL30_9EURY|nr:sugar ABC transporter permease [Salinadaptatus halalkaliphilus]THE63977.1 sugar ABC transporter permease [Salinadaptatus halalkaliphilus]
MSLRDNRNVKSVKTSIRTTRNTVRDALPTVPGVPYLYILPFYVLFGLFLAFPVVYTLYLSFFEYQGPGSGTLLEIDLVVFEAGVPRISSLEFVGLHNYRRLFGDALFLQSVENTIIITLIQMPLMVIVSLAVALMLHAKFVRYSGYFRTAIALPVTANYVAYSAIFLVMFAENFGFINYMLASAGLPTIPWRTDGFWAKVSLALALDWRWMGYNMLILFAGLQGIDRRLYEAAEIDGASRWEKFRYVTLPQLRPILLFVIILSTIGALQLFAEPMIITDGGPANQTITVVMYMYEEAFSRFNLGYASAITYALVVFVTILAYVQLKLGGE